MDFEDVVERYVGDCGIFQILFLLLASLSSMMGGEFLTHNFIAGHQDHWCYIDQLQSVPHYQQK